MFDFQKYKSKRIRLASDSMFIVDPLTFRFSIGLWIVAVLCILVSVKTRMDLSFNSAYMDESDYFFVGRQLLMGLDWPSQTYIFSSNFPLYILGLGDLWSGVWGGRFVCACFGVVSLWCFFNFVRELLGDIRVAGIATLLLSLQAPHLIISKFATYDVICFSFFTAAIWIFVKAVHSEHVKAVMLGIAAALLFLLAVLSKYIVIVYAPLFFLAALIWNWRVALAFIIPLCLVLVVYGVYYSHDLQILYQVQIIGTQGANSSYGEILLIAIHYGALPLVLAIGAFITARHSPFHTVVILILIACALPLIFYHLQAKNMISMYKHMVYSSAFLVTAGAWFLSGLANSRANSIQTIIVYVTLSLTLILSLYQVEQFENGFPNSTVISEYLPEHVGSEVTVLSEDPYLFRHRFFGKNAQGNFFETGWFDNNLDGRHEEDDVMAAVWDGKFDYIYLNGLVTPDLSRKLQDGVLANKYEPVIEVPFSTSDVMNPMTQGRLGLYKAKEPYQGLWPLRRLRRSEQEPWYKQIKGS